MIENENMNAAQGLADKSKSEAESDSLNRRNFLKKSALLSAPVIMTIASGPVWARNCTMSGRLSGNLSDTGPECPPAACSPGYWMQDQHLSSWSENSNYRPGSFFNIVFGVTAFPSTVTLLQAIRKEVSPANPTGSCHQKDQLKDALSQLAFHAVAALQNSLTLNTLYYPHTTATVIQKFQQGFSAYNNCNKGGIINAKDYLEAPYLNAHFCPFGNDGTISDQNHT